MTDEIAKPKDMIQQHGSGTTPASEGDSIQSVEFLSKEYDDLHRFEQNHGQRRASSFKRQTCRAKGQG